MIHQTYGQAVEHVRKNNFASWKTISIHIVELENGRVFYKTTIFDSSYHKCKRCKNALRKNHRGGNHRQACDGSRCNSCGNPYKNFLRPSYNHQTNEHMLAAKDCRSLH